MFHKSLGLGIPRIKGRGRMPGGGGIPPSQLFFLTLEKEEKKKITKISDF